MENDVGNAAVNVKHVQVVRYLRQVLTHARFKHLCRFVPERINNRNYQQYLVRPRAFSVHLNIRLVNVDTQRNHVEEMKEAAAEMEGHAELVPLEDDDLLEVF